MYRRAGGPMGVTRRDPDDGGQRCLGPRSAAPVPVDADVDGETGADTLGEGEPGSGELSTGVDGDGSGSFGLVPGSGGVVLTDGLGEALVPVPPPPPPVPAVEPPAEAVPPGAGVFPTPTPALTAALGALPPPAGASSESDGSGEGSTLPAGLSSSCPGTGSQGALELPDNSVMTMTTA